MIKDYTIIKVKHSSYTTLASISYEQLNSLSNNSIIEIRSSYTGEFIKKLTKKDVLNNKANINDRRVQNYISAIGDDNANRYFIFYYR